MRRRSFIRTYPMARIVSSQAMREAEAAAESVSVRHTRTWWLPANVEAIPTTLAMSAIGRK